MGQPNPEEITESRNEDLRALGLVEDDLQITEEDLKRKQWIDSLPADSRIRQLYYSEADPWLFYHPLAGWVVGGPCDAEAALFKLGWPVMLGDLTREYSKKHIRMWQERSQKLLRYYQNEQEIKDDNEPRTK